MHYWTQFISLFDQRPRGQVQKNCPTFPDDLRGDKIISQILLRRQNGGTWSLKMCGIKLKVLALQITCLIENYRVYHNRAPSGVFSFDKPHLFQRREGSFLSLVSSVCSCPSTSRDSCHHTGLISHYRDWHVSPVCFFASPCQHMSGTTWSKID